MLCNIKSGIVSIPSSAYGGSAKIISNVPTGFAKNLKTLFLNAFIGRFHFLACSFTNLTEIWEISTAIEDFAPRDVNSNERFPVPVNKSKTERQ